MLLELYLQIIFGKTCKTNTLDIHTLLNVLVSKCLWSVISSMVQKEVGWRFGRDGNCQGVWELNPQFTFTDTHFWVKISLKFQSLCKISNISTS